MDIMVSLIGASVLFLLSFSNGIDAKSLSSSEIKLCTVAHNKLRRLHKNTPDLRWDAGLASAAQQYAEELVRLNRRSAANRLVHEKPSRGMGENLYWQDGKKIGSCIDASLAWYKEIKEYNYKTGRSKKGYPVGHFTQLVWRKTRLFGVGIASMKSRKYRRYGNIETFIVAKYLTKGNFYYRKKRLQTYKKNVQPRKPGAKMPTLEELYPKQKCENAAGGVRCEEYVNFGYSCKQKQFRKFMKENCFKKCKYC